MKCESGDIAESTTTASVATETSVTESSKRFTSDITPATTTYQPSTLSSQPDPNQLSTNKESTSNAEHHHTSKDRDAQTTTSSATPTSTISPQGEPATTVVEALSTLTQLVQSETMSDPATQSSKFLLS